MLSKRGGGGGGGGIICSDTTAYLHPKKLFFFPFTHLSPLPIHQSWPNDALTIVARRFLDDVEMDDDVKESCVEMCKDFHQSTRKLSEKYLAVLQRHNYVTPTSYLELISTYKTLLSRKRG